MRQIDEGETPGKMLARRLGPQVAAHWSVDSGYLRPWVIEAAADVVLGHRTLGHAGDDDDRAALAWTVARMVELGRWWPWTPIC
jgi:hypothetical protein